MHKKPNKLRHRKSKQVHKVKTGRSEEHLSNSVKALDTLLEMRSCFSLSVSICVVCVFCCVNVQPPPLCSLLSNSEKASLPKEEAL